MSVLSVLALKIGQTTGKFELPAITVWTLDQEEGLGETGNTGETPLLDTYTLLQLKKNALGLRNIFLV